MTAIQEAPRTEAEPHGKIALLDAAETLFALHGYFGASMRDITRAAAVPHGLATYHFRSKDDLFKQVMARRVPDIMALLADGLSQALASPTSGIRRVEAIVDAYIGAHLEFAARGAAETSYVRLAQQIIAVGKRRHLAAELTVRYNPIYERYIAALAEALPDADAPFLESRFHLMRLVLAGVQVDIELPAALSHNRTRSMQDILRVYCSNGFLQNVPDE